MIGPFIHDIDPIVATIGGIHIWWYGLCFTTGFLAIFFWLRRNRLDLKMEMRDVYTLTIYMACGVLLGGRLIEVFFYEWPYYGENMLHIPAVWLGGMSTHGILLGAILALFLYCKREKRSFLETADVLAIAGAFIMGIGRIGNYIDGQIVGSVTDVWWGVKFPDVEGYRHPVVLYDGIKNFMLIPLLLLIRRARPPKGVVMAHFILWYGFLRIFVDYFREYRTDFYGFPPGQEFNLFMTLVGIGLLVWLYGKRKRSAEKIDSTAPPARATAQTGSGFRVRHAVFMLLLIIPVVIPGDWTHDIPERYGHRHSGLEYSFMYPRIQVYNEVKP